MKIDQRVIVEGFSAEGTIVAIFRDGSPRVVLKKDNRDAFVWIPRRLFFFYSGERKAASLVDIGDGAITKGRGSSTLSD